MTGQHSAPASACSAQRGSRGRADAGLVPSINNVNNGELSEPILIDKLEARCTRLRKNLGVAAKWLSQSGYQAWMLTFTYRDGCEWQPEHVRDALQRLRVWLKRAHGATLRYVWVMETKARKSGEQVGRVIPHYHVVVWMPHQVGQDDLKMDACGYWNHGMTNAVKAVAAVRYVMKYASKFDNAGAFPKGARIYGMGGITPDQRLMRRWVNWPSFVQGNASYTCQWRRAVGGGWLDSSTGEIWASEWGLVCTSRTHTRLKRLRTHPRKINASGPFSWLPFAAVL